MSMTKEQIVAEALTLPEADREALADEIWRSIDGDAREQIDAAWSTEIQRRIDAYSRGDIIAKPVDEVVDRLRNKARP